MSDESKESDDSVKTKAQLAEEAGALIERPESQVLSLSDEDSEAPEQAAGTPAQLGYSRYVHASFFAAATLVGYLAARLFASVWNWLVEWPFAVQHVPQLLRLSEDERGSVGSVVGVILGIWILVYIYKKATIRTWADQVAGELAKVSWPDRDAVTKGTVIVIVASLVATVYVTILDRLWGFATRLIYGS